jgi:hypothetical protein
MSAAIILDVVHTPVAPPWDSEIPRPTIEGFVRHAKR